MGFNLKSNYFFEDDIAKCIKAPNAAQPFNPEAINSDAAKVYPNKL